MIILNWADVRKPNITVDVSILLEFIPIHQGHGIQSIRIKIYSQYHPTKAQFLSQPSQN